MVFDSDLIREVVQFVEGLKRQPPLTGCHLVKKIKSCERL